MKKSLPKEPTPKVETPELPIPPVIEYVYSTYERDGMMRSCSDGFCEKNHKTSWSPDKKVLFCDTCFGVIKHTKIEEVKTDAQEKKEKVRVRNKTNKARKMIQTKMDF